MRQNLRSEHGAACMPRRFARPPCVRRDARPSALTLPNGRRVSCRRGLQG